MQVFLPFALVQLGNAMVSMRRLNQYLVMEERTDEVGAPPYRQASIFCIILSSIWKDEASLLLSC